MGKKQKEETPNINATPNRDIIQRLNFLYQASVYLQSIEPSASTPISNHPSSSGKFRSKSKGKAKEIQISMNLNMFKNLVERRRNSGENRLHAISHEIMFSACASLDRKQQLKCLKKTFPMLFGFQLTGF